MTYAIVFDWGWYLEPYCFYVTYDDAVKNIFKAKRCRPRCKVRIVEVS